MSWAQVKFLYENQRAEVETCFFKVVVEGLVKPEDLEVGDTYSVFWSPNPEETPRDIMDQGNAVLDIDGLPELERRRRKKDGPLKGYYNAVLLSLKEDEDIERPYKRELSKSNCLPSHVKRTKVPSARAIEAKLNSGTSKNVKVSQSIPEPNGGSKRCVLPKSTVVESTKRNLENLFNKVAGSKSKSAKSSGRQHFHDSDPDYEPEIPEVRNAEYWRKKFEESQREVELTKRSLESVHKKEKAKTEEEGLKGQNRDGESERALKGIESPLHDDFDMDAFNEFSNIIDRHSTGMKEGRAGSSKSVEKAADNEDHTEEIVGDSMNSTEPVTLSDSPDSESSEDDFKVAPRRVKPPAKGPAGDSAALFQFLRYTLET
ncbi:hypothetical protein ONE63_005153 [Megalurothrips usitatus]|uniref:Uncharacterized protein n=1 Tax=Megalurothrips usitatus TaxID=439358 RepID=A0AAV7XZF7_9NEOP|nr:hypothetical protein ONE63_005153 [Megalurothrips usitatus]